MPKSVRRKRTTPAQPLIPPPADRRRFRTRLLAWSRRNGRDLPWRRTDDPYHILVSEIMLQQTQVDRVLPKYHEWLGKYPSLSALADAPIDDVTETWRPLGYNIRPRRLHTIAQEAVSLLRDGKAKLWLPGRRLLVVFARRMLLLLAGSVGAVLMLLLTVPVGAAVLLLLSATGAVLGEGKFEALKDASAVKVPAGCPLCELLMLA